jgi:hypothetical protein
MPRPPAGGASFKFQAPIPKQIRKDKIPNKTLDSHRLLCYLADIGALGFYTLFWFLGFV